MDNQEIERILTEHGVNPTAVRILVYRNITEFHHAFSLADVEAALGSVDKSTLFRTLTLFAARHLLHQVEDGSGSKKYCVCHNSHPCALGDLHCHFRCERCGTTYCLPRTAIPAMTLPEGFAPQRAELVFSGLCPDCNR